MDWKTLKIIVIVFGSLFLSILLGVGCLFLILIPFPIGKTFKSESVIGSRDSEIPDQIILRNWNHHYFIMFGHDGLFRKNYYYAADYILKKGQNEKKLLFFDYSSSLQEPILPVSGTDLWIATHIQSMNAYDVVLEIIVFNSEKVTGQYVLKKVLRFAYEDKFSVLPYCATEGIDGNRRLKIYGFERNYMLDVVKGKLETLPEDADFARAMDILKKSKTVATAKILEGGDVSSSAWAFNVLCRNLDKDNLCNFIRLYFDERTTPEGQAYALLALSRIHPELCRELAKNVDFTKLHILEGCVWSDVTKDQFIKEYLFSNDFLNALKMSLLPADGYLKSNR